MKKVDKNTKEKKGKNNWINYAQFHFFLSINWWVQFSSCITLLSEILFDPTNVVFISFTMPAGDWVGDGLYTMLALGLMWFKDDLLFGVPVLRS